MFAAPGKKLMFMGDEFGQGREWDHDGALQWHLLEDGLHSGLKRWVRDLNTIYRGRPALHELDTHPDGWQWINADDSEQSVLSFLRKGHSSPETILFVANFTPVPRHNYRVGVPVGGQWEEVLNSDAPIYGGSGQGNIGGVATSPVAAHGHLQSLILTVPPLGIVALPVPRQAMSRPERLGSWVEGGRTHFRVWAPQASTVTVEFFRMGSGHPYLLDLQRGRDGYFAGATGLAHADARYRYRIDGGDSWPDPASRFQPEGVHGPSEVIDPDRFAWTDENWRGPDRDRMVIYELHVGTFTRKGTYAGVVEHLADLKELGVTVIELLPLNACDGRWGWGYDGAALFAPWHVYGTPDELRAVIDRAHALGLGVILDVVYNHFGPAGNYTGQFSNEYVKEDVRTAWGPAINLGGPGSKHVRAFFIENARSWIKEYHFDGFRVDATHAFVDDGPVPFLSEFALEVRASTDRQLILIAEDHRQPQHDHPPEHCGRLGLRRCLGRRTSTTSYAAF